jgi:tRNA dimethylallyltransferase
MSYNLITILGPTASGKTSLAANLAYRLNTEIISADSRQVYKGMDIGTGKDLDDYNVNGIEVPYHLINICNAGEKYNVFSFQKDFMQAFLQITEKAKIPILCGGSGLYIEAVLKDYKLTAVPINDMLRDQLNEKTDDELIQLLGSFKKLHNTTDTSTRKRLIRAIEIEIYQQLHDFSDDDLPKINSIIFGLNFDREEQKLKITKRLKERLANGMINEVNSLLDNGILKDDLIYYGLEYKFVTQYLNGTLKYDEMFNLLNIAIHQFSKRQMTWFRKMEREGFKIHWLNGNSSVEHNVNLILTELSIIPT